MSDRRVVLECRDLVKTYSAGETAVRVLKGINLRVYEGEIIVIMGPSGSGKTTLLSILGTLEKPSSGDVIIAGTNVTELSEEELTRFRLEKLGFVFQSYNLLRNLTAIENVMFPMLVSGNYTFGEARRKAHELLKLVGLEKHVDKFPGQLSGGQQQRVAVARALANDPEIIFMDEPTGNLDAKSSARVLSLVKVLNEIYGQTFMVVTHNPELTMFASRVLYIRDGVVYQNPPDGLFKRSVSEELEESRRKLSAIVESQVKILRIDAENLYRRAKSGLIDEGEFRVLLERFERRYRLLEQYRKI
ncbi:MAG: ABC transporter ATP-binding protein [Thermoprotei archaeon]|nr:MAG: ABC transporter ATP-binding protein [Thermoprotei archaeon]